MTDLPGNSLRDIEFDAYRSSQFDNSQELFWDFIWESDKEDIFPVLEVLLGDIHREVLKHKRICLYWEDFILTRFEEMEDDDEN